MFIFSCQQEESLKEDILLNHQNTDTMMKLGKKLENPYSVDNMKKASNILMRKGTSNDLNITATHLYIKFKPKNEEELSILKQDSTLVLYSYPLDYEIEEEGDFFRDPEVPIEQPTYQYCAVKVDKKLPKDIEHEILENLFIPDEYKDTEDTEDTFLKKNKISNETVELLVDEAFKITNNLEKEKIEESIKLKGRRSKWKPSGTITMNDDTLGNIGVEGLKVRARRWFTTHIGFTGSDGKFSCDGKFRGKARYKLDWERHHFALRKGGFSSAQKKGAKVRKKSWNWHITSGEHKYYATIFRAAYHYYYKNIKGLRRPPLNSTFRTQLRIGAFTQTKDALGTHSNVWRSFGLSTPIKIYSYSRSSRQTYATTIHELAHASHWNMDRSDFNKTETKVKESWARGVQWELTRMVYPEYRGGSTFRPNYTQVIVDAIDPNYSSTRTNLNNGIWNDNVTGYSLKQIEDALKGQKEWNGWKNNIKNKFDNDTEGNLDALFANWD